MPAFFNGLLTPDNYNYLMGLSGLISAFVVWTLFSKGI